MIIALAALIFPVLVRAESTSFFMWRAQAKLGKPAHLFGALHYATASCYPLHPEIQRAYNDANVLAVEVDLTRAEAPALALLLGRYRDGRRLRQEIPEELADEVEALAHQYGWDLSGLDSTRPWLVASMLSAADFEAAGYRRQLGIDLHFLESAKRDRKKVVELESIRQQFDVFNALPQATQFFLLADSVASIKSGDNVATLEQMMEAWRNGDSAAFRTLAEGGLVSVPSHEKYVELVYQQRNRSMGARLDALVRRGQSIFVVVGAAHLAGPDSLLEVLRSSGYEIEQVSVNDPLPEDLFVSDRRAGTCGGFVGLNPMTAPAH